MAYNSNHIEGSRLTHEQTRYIFETSTVGLTENETVLVDDIVEASNHFRAFDQVLNNANARITPRLVKGLHRTLKQATSDAQSDWFRVGAWKAYPNEVGGRETTAPEDVDTQMSTLIDSYESSPSHTLDDLLDFHVRFERIHPFQDGNGRIGRLLLFKECLRWGIVPFVRLSTQHWDCPPTHPPYVVQLARQKRRKRMPYTCPSTCGSMPASYVGGTQLSTCQHVSLYLSTDTL